MVGCILFVLGCDSKEEVKTSVLPPSIPQLDDASGTKGQGPRPDGRGKSTDDKSVPSLSNRPVAPGAPEIEPPVSSRSGAPGDPDAGITAPVTPEQLTAAKTPDPRKSVETKDRKKSRPQKIVGKKQRGPKIDAKALYMKSCKKCHGSAGDSNTKMGKKYEIPLLKGSKLSVAKAKKLIGSGVPKTKMKAYAKKLSTSEIAALAAFVTRL